jgi:hypothetical protein
MIISIDGLDNSGKTTQIEWLSKFPEENIIKAPPLHKFDDYWNSIQGVDFSNWWFINSSTKEHSHLISRSAQKRNISIPSTSVTVVDRGLLMLRNVCIATSIAKDLPFEESIKIVNKIFSSNCDFGLEDFRILLLYNNDVTESVNNLILREREPVDSRYLNYQKNLYRLILDDHLSNQYNLTIFTEGKSILQIQNEIRNFLTENIDTVSINPLFKNIHKIWGIGGLSESGKSITGEYLKYKHGFERKKISYFLSNAQRSKSIKNVYEYDDKFISNCLIEELELFCRNHSDCENISIESLHRYDFTKELKIFFGNKFLIFFLKASLELRAERSFSTREQVIRKDKEKTERGAEKIENIADLVFDNTKTKLSLLFFIDNGVLEIYPKKLEAVKVSNLNFGNAALRGKIENFLTSLEDTSIKLISITGSGGLGHWRKDWSDIDVLVVGENDSLDKCKELSKIFDSFSFKTSITMYNLKEFNSTYLKHGTIRAKRLITSGKLKPIYVSDSFSIKVSPNNKYLLNEMEDLSIILPALRKLIVSDENNYRQIFKHIILIMKICLRTEGIEVESDLEVIAKFNEHHKFVNLPLYSENNFELIVTAAKEILLFLEQ